MLTKIIGAALLASLLALAVMGWQLRAALQREGALRVAVEAQQSTIQQLRDHAAKEAQRLAAYTRQLAEAETQSEAMQAEIDAARRRLRAARAAGGDDAGAVSAAESLRRTLRGLHGG